MFLSQTKDTVDLLCRANMLGAEPMSSPATPHLRLCSNSGELLPDPTTYCSLVGALQYLTLTRPGTSFVVNHVSQFMHTPTTEHMSTVVKRILCFLKGTLQFGLHLRPGPLRLIAYCDADWAGNPMDHAPRATMFIFAITWSRGVIATHTKNAQFPSLPLNKPISSSGVT